MKYIGLYIRPCRQEDLPGILALQEAVFLILPDTALLRRNTPDLLLRGLTPPNLTVGVYDGDLLVAVGMLVNPKPPETDLRANLKRFTVEKALDMKLVMVRGEYRGRGLQKSIMWILEKMAYLQGVTHLCTSVSPDNYFSLRNVTGLGYQYDHPEELYNGLLRNVYVKKIAVSDYRRKAAVAAGRYENKPYTPLDVDLSHCISGDASLSDSGDIAEFTDLVAGKSVYGLLIRHEGAFVLLPDKDNVWTMMDFSPAIQNRFILDKVWINTTDNLPFAEI